jgi:uncharacterized protein (UPF0335 family)
MAREISSTDSVIDSRDVIARIEELQGEREALVEQLQDAREDGADEQAIEECETDLQNWEDDHKEELDALLALQSQCEGYGDWDHGETLIHDGYFQTYAKELAEETGMVNEDARWPNNHIDWESAAEELQQDYMSIDFDGETYWMRS